MVSSIRSRLWLSYAILIVTALSVVAVVLLIYLIRNPYAYRQVTTRLNTAEKMILRRRVELVNDPANKLLEDAADLFDVRVLVYSPDGYVLRDTRPGAESITLPQPGGIARRQPATRDASGRLWLYTLATLEDGNILLVTAPRPRVAGLSLFADELMPLFLGGAGMALLLSLVLAYVVARWVADPLQRMLLAARAMPSEAAKPVEPGGPREVQEVMRAFNSMLKRVQVSQASQREFVANVSHELKTPLTSIQGFAQAMLDGTAGTPEAQTQAAQVIYNESGRMHRLTVDLLELARLDAGTADLNMAPLDLPMLLNSVVEKFSPLAARAGVTISLKTEALSAISGDGDRLAQVFTNLLDNALKFTPAGGVVIVTTREEQAEVEVEVRDTGSGISVEALPYIFDRFYQEDASRALHGAGLGLAIVHEIVTAHGGKISVQSQIGQGTMVTVRLPLAKDNTYTVSTRK